MKQNACKENEARLSLASLLATLLLLRKSHFCGEQRDYHQVRVLGKLQVFRRIQHLGHKVKQSTPHPPPGGGVGW